MTGSPSYARIRAQVDDVVSRVPAGRLTTYAATDDELEAARFVRVPLDAAHRADPATPLARRPPP